jgi:short-subunit dehydrogenase
MDLEPASPHGQHIQAPVLIPFQNSIDNRCAANVDDTLCRSQHNPDLRVRTDRIPNHLLVTIFENMERNGDSGEQYDSQWEKRQQLRLHATIMTSQLQFGQFLGTVSMKISGRIVLITGASEGIGAACVTSFRRRGARLVLVARQREKLERLDGPDTLIAPADVTVPEQRERAVKAALQRFGAIDILVNNAGIGLYAPASRAALDDVRQMFELNVLSALAMAQLIIPAMIRQRRGTIVNVGSIAGKVTLPWFTTYSASKYALGSLTDGLRMELRPFGIHAMLVCPGYVRTGFQDHVIAGSPPAAVRRAKRFAIDASTCAEAIVRGVERNARTVVAPGAGWLLIALQRAFPWLVERRLAAMLERYEQE